ncbi:hypothetical protein VYU27_007491 [Nannochloropsis oceanica]
MFPALQLFGELLDAAPLKQLVPTNPVQDLHPKTIKHLMTETYCAMKKSIVDELEEIKGRFLPSLAILIDIWEDKFSRRGRDG